MKSSLARGLLLLAAVVVLSTADGRAQEPDISDTIPVCNGCHGKAGIPAQPDYPIIWGQEFYYLYVQLKDYAAGRRQHEIMSEIARRLSKEERQALAMHFSKKRWPATGFQASGEAVTRGRRAAASGMCTQCHLGSYMGDSRVPRLAGQRPAYLERTMLAFKTKERTNAPSLTPLFEAYSEADIRAMAHYLAGL